MIDFSSIRTALPDPPTPSDGVPQSKALKEEVHLDEDLDGPTESRALKMKFRYRRAYSEMQLLDALAAPGFHFEPGWCYNFLTRGDVDALSFLKAVVRQQHIERLTLSTWCAYPEDIKQLRKWMDDGRIGRLDLYLGEIYRNNGRHGVNVPVFREIFKGAEGLSLCVARNHAKVAAGRGSLFDFVIQTSANLNTNPKVENACILIPDPSGESEAHELVAFYEDFFSTVQPLD